MSTRGGARGVHRRLAATASSSTAAAAAAPANSDDFRVTSVFDLEILDCSICMEPLASPIFQCQNGHILCASCRSKLLLQLGNLACPSCKKPTGTIRNSALEKLIGTLRVRCKFAHLGCPDMVKFSEKPQHECMCKFQPLSCPFWECTQFQGPYESLQEHVKENHPDNWVILQHQEDVEFEMRATDRMHVLFHDLSGLYFVLHRHHSMIGHMCYLTVPTELSARYSAAVHYTVYQMKIRTDDGSTFKVETQCFVEDSMNKGPPGDGFVVVPEEDIRVKICLVLALAPSTRLTPNP